MNTATPLIDENALDEQQLKAIELCCNINAKNRLCAITGAAGTGKTTIIRLVHRLLTEAGYCVVLCAPTGKASKRIYEATGIPAMTIHRLLEYPYPGERDSKTGEPLTPGEPKRWKGNPLTYNVVLCDEYAMVSQELHRNVIDALPRMGVLRAFGDVNQLQPIEKDVREEGKPSPFMVLLSVFNCVVLSTNYRQQAGSGIIENALRILRGMMPVRRDDFLMKITDYPVDVIKRIIERSPVDFTSIDNQILIPAAQRARTSVSKVNPIIQQIAKSETLSAGWLDVPRHKWAHDNELRLCVGDKVIITQNNYNIDGREVDAEYRNDPDRNNQAFNGETGIVQDLSSDYGEVVIDLGDRVVMYPPVVLVCLRGSTRLVEIDPRRDISLGYAITTHKAQGSEFNHVAYVVNKAIFYMLNKNNFYTGVTRAKEKVHLIGDQRGIITSLRPPQIRKRKELA